MNDILLNVSKCLINNIRLLSTVLCLKYSYIHYIQIFKIVRTSLRGKMVQKRYSLSKEKKKRENKLNFIFVPAYCTIIDDVLSAEFTMTNQSLSKKR
jgi:hypothetical protein